MTATDVTGFYAFFSARRSGGFLTKLHSEPGEKGKNPLEKKGKIHWIKFKKSSGDGAPK